MITPDTRHQSRFMSIKPVVILPLLFFHLYISLEMKRDFLFSQITHFAIACFNALTVCECCPLLTSGEAYCPVSLKAIASDYSSNKSHQSTRLIN